MFSGPRIPAQRKKRLVAPHLCFLSHPRTDKGGAQHRGENGSKIWAPKDCRPTGTTVFHEHRPHIRTSGKEGGESWRAGAQGTRESFPFCSKETYNASRAQYFQNTPETRKLRNQRMGITRQLKQGISLFFPLKVSLKHLCVSLSSVYLESTGLLPVLLPSSFLCHFLPHTQEMSSRCGGKEQACSVPFMLIAKSMGDKSQVQV